MFSNKSVRDSWNLYQLTWKWTLRRKFSWCKKFISVPFLVFFEATKPIFIDIFLTVYFISIDQICINLKLFWSSRTNRLNVSYTTKWELFDCDLMSKLLFSLVEINRNSKKIKVKSHVSYHFNSLSILILWKKHSLIFFNSYKKLQIKRCTKF